MKTWSVFSFKGWFRKAGRASALAACLMASFPPLPSWASDSPAGSPSAVQAELTPLIELLKHADAEQRKHAAEQLAWMGPQAEAALPQLHQSLIDNDPIVRATAARAIWEISQNAEVSVPVLVEILESQNTGHQELAAYLLGPMGESAQAAIPSLRQATQQPHLGLQVHAAEAWVQIDPVATAPVDILVQALNHSNADLRSLAAMACGSVSPLHAERVVPGLTAALVDPNPGVRTSAELALPSFNLDVVHSDQHFPTPEQTAFPDENLVEAEHPLITAENTTPFAPASKKPEVRLEFSEDLQKAVRDLSNENPVIRKNALERIGWLGPEAMPALTDVILCLDDTQPDVRAYAAKTLWEVDRASAQAAVNVLSDLVDSTHPGIRPLAAFYLGAIGPHAAPALPTLKRALANTQSQEQLQIAEAVARINPADPDAVTVLIGGLRDPESQVRFQAAYALGEVSVVHASRVVPELATATKDQSPQVRQAAELALTSFTPDQIAAVTPQPLPSSAEVGLAEPAAPIPAIQSLPESIPATIEEATPEVSGNTQVVLLDPEPVALSGGVSGESHLVPTPEYAMPATPPQENRLGLGDDYKPITAVKISISPKRRAEDGKLLALPTNYGAAWLQEVGSRHQPNGESRPWTLQAAQYAASGFCHRPLYFEEINLERYGHNFGPVFQPFVSAASFYGTVPLMPYLMAAEHPWECQYTLGHYRSGAGVPFQYHRLPGSKSGTLLEAGIITGLFFAIY